MGKQAEIFGCIYAQTPTIENPGEEVYLYTK